MPDWQNRIDLRFARVENEDEVNAAGRKVAEKLRKLGENFRFPADLLHESDRGWVDLQIEEISDRFEDATDFEEFNYALEDLYDFGDMQFATVRLRAFHEKAKVLWVDFAERPGASPTPNGP